MCAHVCICVKVWEGVHVCSCVYIYIHACVSKCVRMCTCVCMCVQVRNFVHTCVHVMCVFTCVMHEGLLRLFPSLMKGWCEWGWG